MENQVPTLPALKLLTLGNSGVGKTSLIGMFADKMFNPNMISTVGVDFKQKKMDLNGKQITLRIWDTAGQEQFKTITRQYYRGAMGILLVYDVTSLQSFQHVTYWIRNINQYASPHVPKVLIANKVDLPNRQVPIEAGVEFATSLGLPYFECSAMDYASVEPIFVHMAQMVLTNIAVIAPGYLDPPPTAPVAITVETETPTKNGCSC